MKCILCGGGNTVVFYAEPKTSHLYHKCADCDLRFLDPAFRLGPEQEKIRYLHHENTPTDPRYREFLRPLTDLIEGSGVEAEVLDFGCGEGSVLRYLLEPRGFAVALFDPFFFPDRRCLERTYDFIAASEVVEHLFEPAKEFALLRRLIKSGGRLAIMTAQCSNDMDFGAWYYRRDPTHVAFYSRETLFWIREKFAFAGLRVHSERLVEFLA